MTPEEKKKADEFASWLLRVGEGHTDGSEPGLLKLPQECCIPCDSESSVHNFVDAIYPGIATLEPDENVRCEYFNQRAILAPQNTSVDELNRKILERLPGEQITFYSADSASDSTGQSLDNLPIEYLNGITMPGYPLHKTVLKVGVPVILLRNIDPSSGLCNGTRLLVTRLREHVIEGMLYQILLAFIVSVSGAY
jgi:hypothetical protein